MMHVCLYCYRYLLGLSDECMFKMNHRTFSYFLSLLYFKMNNFVLFLNKNVCNAIFVLDDYVND